MQVTVDRVDQITVAVLAGELDANTAPLAQQEVLAAAEPGGRMVLDLSGVPYMSSAGLRMLLSTYRQVSGNGGKIVLVGVVDEIRDTMSVTGFLKFFSVLDTREAGIQALNQ